MVGVLVFSTASLLCGLAWNIAVLDIARALQGIGGAALFATALALIGAEYRGPEIGGAIAIWGATVGAAVASGPLVGGILTDALGWRWVFFVNVPVGAFALWVAVTQDARVARRAGDAHRCLGAAHVLGVALPDRLRRAARQCQRLEQRADLGSLVGGAVLLAVFVAVEHRQTRPMLDLSLFRHPGFVGVSVATFCIGAGMFALFPYLSIYLQDVLGYSPLGGRAPLPAADGLRLRRAADDAEAGAATRRSVCCWPAAWRSSPRLLLLMYGLNTELALDRAAARPHRLGDRNRPGEPRDRCCGASRGRPVAHREWPPGINNTFRLSGVADRSRGAGSDSRAPRGPPRWRHAGPAQPCARRGGQRDRDPRRRRSAEPRPSGDGRLRQRAERDPAGRLRGRRHRRAGGRPPDAAVGAMSFRIAAGLSS